MGNLSKEYRAMIYTAVATIYFYRENLWINKKMTVTEFKLQNGEVIDRVIEETKELFSYHLSGEQINRAVYAFMNSYFNPQSVKNTPIHKMEKPATFHNSP